MEAIPYHCTSLYMYIRITFVYRGRFTEAVDSLIPKEDRGELKRLYGEACFDEPNLEIEAKKRPFVWEQFAIRASFRRKSLTVDDWLGFCEIPAADSLYSNGFVRLWDADDPAPPENCQQGRADSKH